MIYSSHKRIIDIHNNNIAESQALTRIGEKIGLFDKSESRNYDEYSWFLDKNPELQLEKIREMSNQLVEKVGL